MANVFELSLIQEGPLPIQQKFLSKGQGIQKQWPVQGK
jgi:hypothetical protein